MTVAPEALVGWLARSQTARWFPAVELLQLLVWTAGRNRGAVPPVVKRRRILKEARSAGIGVLVETGTYRGITVDRLHRHFDQLVSIELDDQLWAAAVARFSHLPHVRILHGDSGMLLPGVVEEVQRPAVYWLDAHYSGGITARGEEDTPVVTELEAVARLGTADDVILIDDARLFDEEPYPSIEKLREVVAAHRPEWQVGVDRTGDVIHIGKSRTPL